MQRKNSDFVEDSITDLPPLIKSKSNQEAQSPPMSPSKRYSIVGSSGHFSSRFVFSRSEQLQKAIDDINDEPTNVRLWCDLGNMLLDKEKVSPVI